MAERFSLDGREKEESLERYEAVGYDALVAASTDVTGDHLETPNGFNESTPRNLKAASNIFCQGTLKILMA